MTSVLRWAAVAMVASLGSCSPPAPPEQPPLRVGAEAAKPAAYSSPVILTGDVVARVTSDLSFKIAGRIDERKADVGDHVTAGEVLAELDPQQQKAALLAAQADVDTAEAQIRENTSAFERQRALIGPGFTTRREYDSAEAALRTSQASLQGAKARLGNAQDQLDQTVLRAGADGVITVRRAEAGEVVEVAQTVFTIAQDGPRDAVFNAYESIFTREPADETIEVSLLANPAIHRRAHLREIAPIVDQSTGTIKVKFEIIDPALEMTLGTPIKGIGEFKPHEMTALSWTALSSDLGAPAVWIIDPSNQTVSLKPVMIDTYETGRVLIRDGLRPGQLVVTNGQQLLWPGRKVEPVAPKNAKADSK